MQTEETRIARNTALAVLALVALRLVAAALTPLTFDEAYYWMWSRHLAGGYYDHPPMVALVIRAGTMIGGDTAFGVRVVSILSGLPMSYALYRSAQLLFANPRLAALATVLGNVTLMVAVGTMIVTPDAPLLVASSFVLFFLAKLADSGRGAWWLAVGAAVGAAGLSKYSAMFFGPAILIWLVLIPDLRRWLRSPWTYVGGVVGIAVLSPVLIWNAQHQWVSILKQTVGRARVEGFRPVFVLELIPTQFVFATPLVFILAAMGLWLLARRRAGTARARVLINSMFWTIVVYFAWHALHARVEANWFAPVYPALALAAAVAGWHSEAGARWLRLRDFCLRWAVPLGVAMFVAVTVQANTGILSGYRRDATVRTVGVGWPELARGIEEIRRAQGASCVLASDYGTTSWLAFYLPADVCVVQQGQRIRWVNSPEPAPELLAGKLLYVDAPGATRPPFLEQGFERVTELARLPRKRGPLVIEIYAISLLEGAKGDVLDRSPPPELSR
ncbi:MAG: glycosyltransferase family 39 protein [Alphaproteobacteria bacterium]|nr:glycosyltransferase family 39 protein [Alphaproteobacteria bacterium]